MVALALSSILVFGLVELFVSTTKNARGADSLMELQDNGRTALQILTSDIRRSGYFAGLLDVSLVAGSTGAVESATASPCAAAGTTWARMIDQAVFGVNDPGDATVGTAYPCITAAEYGQDDILVLRYTPAVPVAAGALIAGRPYLRTGLRSNRGALFLGSATGNADNDVGDANAEDFPLAAHAYFVGPSGRSCDGIAIPSLWRKAISDTGTPENQELVPGVERFQVRYLEGDQYFGANAVTTWDNITAVEVQLLVRTACPEVGFNNDTTFALGGTISPAFTPNDGFRRRVFTAVTAIRNRG
jgi:type IV pilus assembly protein PilW